jgi:UDP-N-acetylmuramoyl-tripeptide--D-alanyl-D-alanine ligase
MRVLAGELGRRSANSLGFALSFAHCEGPAQAIDELREYGLTHGDAVLVKGSNSIGLGGLVKHFTQAPGKAGG